MGVQPNSYPADPAPGWLAEYVGIDYELRGRGPDAYDCWGICWYALERHFGATAPKAEGVEWNRKSPPTERAAAAEMIETTAEHDFLPIPVGWEQPGDVVVLRIKGQPLHCGLVAAPGWMLHSEEGTGSVAERYDGPVWHHRVLGFYRLRAMTA